MLLAGPVVGILAGFLLFDVLLPEEVRAQPSATPPATSGETPSGGSVSTFHTDLKGLRSLQVHCTSAEGSGVDSVSLTVARSDACTVTAIGADRSRLVAVVEPVSAGSWTCFEGGERRCRADGGLAP
jgi:hypothetical protein